MPEAHATFTKRPAQFRALSRVAATQWLFLLTMVLAIPLAIIPFVALLTISQWIAAAWMVVGIGPLAFVLLLPSRVDIGPDGMMLSWMGRKRFVAFRNVVGAHTYIEGFGRNQIVGTEIVLHGGEKIRVPVGGVQDGPRAEALAECICDGLTDFDRGDVGDIDGVTSLLQQGDRDVSEWFQVLRTLGEGTHVSFREAPVKAEGLWRIVENHAAPAHDRVAAAVALRASLNEEGQKRLRVAAGATLDPKLRVAIDIAANGDDDGQLEAALREAAASR